jgi:phosphoglycolate phosphatase-like HAD superfamily hydrolase
MSKLESAGLAGEFDWSLSTFGDTAANRPELARRAARALADSTIDVAVAIGDTPLDVSAAQFAGLPVVAIASGSFNVSRLRRSQPDLVIEDLVTGRPSLDALLRILTERRASR